MLNSPSRRILFLCKRQYNAKDLLDDKFGRLREIPIGLAKLGNSVKGYCLSYERRPTGRFLDKEAKSEVEWVSINAVWPRLMGWIRFAITILKKSKEFRPDLIIAASNSTYGILGVWLGRRLGIPCVFDLYDNFESFKAIHLPGVKPLYYWALNNADLVTCVSQPLYDHIKSQYHRKGFTMVLVNGVRKDIFTPLDKRECRQRLNLPQDAILIGVSGLISRSRDIETLFSAFEILNKKIPDSYMVLAGPKDSNLYIPDNKNILYLGVQPQDIIPSVIASLDLSIICNKDSSFGRFCFPLKFVETIACHTPLIASSVGVTKSMLKDYVDLLFDPGNSSQLSEAMLFQLKNKIIPDISINSWENIAEQLNDQIDELFQPR